MGDEQRDEIYDEIYLGLYPMTGRGLALLTKLGAWNQIWQDRSHCVSQKFRAARPRKIAFPFGGFLPFIAAQIRAELSTRPISCKHISFKPISLKPVHAS